MHIGQVTIRRNTEKHPLRFAITIPYADEDERFLLMHWKGNQKWSEVLQEYEGNVGPTGLCMLSGIRGLRPPPNESPFPWCVCTYEFPNANLITFGKVTQVEHLLDSVAVQPNRLATWNFLLPFFRLAGSNTQGPVPF